MKNTWFGIILIGIVIYFGIVHSASDPLILLNSHAIILVIGGTLAVSFLTYSPQRLNQVLNFILFGFLFKIKKTELETMKDIISKVDLIYGVEPRFPLSNKNHPFILESFKLLNNPKYDIKKIHETLLDRRNSVKRQYLEDAKI